MTRHHQDMMTITHTFSLIAALAAASCSDDDNTKIDFRVSHEVPFCEEPHPPICEFYQCGSNSPVVNGFPINGLRPDGECNFEGVQLMPRSLTGGANNKCDGSTLDVRHNKLVGLRPDGTVACRDKDLEGASFVLRSWVKNPAGPGQRTLNVRIGHIEPYKLKNGESRTAYRMTAAGGSLCNSRDASAARETLGIEVISGLNPDPPAGKDLVIPISSELYDRLGFPQYTISWARKESEWLHLACVDDALAKRSLYDLYTDNVENSRAALMMLVANYCGNLHATMRGVPVAWKLVDDEVEPAAAGGGALEAKWGPEGAVCVSRLRLLRDGAETPVPGALSEVLAQVECKGCSAAPDWLNAVRECKALKGGASAGGAPPPKPARLPTCEECTDTKCKGRLFHSYVEGAR